jgi:MarR family transcriptional regulator for hemolysin
MPATKMNSSIERIGPLFQVISRTWRSILDSRLAPLGLSEARWQCLLHLGRANNPIAQVELAERMGITPPTLVKLLDRLEEDGWIERLPEPQDRRAKLVGLTSKACDMTRKIEQEAQLLRQEIWSEISADERDALLKTLLQLEQKLDQLNSKTPSLEGEPS